MFDMMSAMTAWREDGQHTRAYRCRASTAGKVDRTRPLCAYPQVAKYKGSGSIDDAENFVCAAPGVQ